MQSYYHKIILLSFVILLSLSSALALGEFRHLCTTEKAFAIAGDTGTTREIKKAEECFWIGLFDPDVTVSEYWKGYPWSKEYSDTHGLNYYYLCKQYAKTDCEIAFCDGILVHEIEDLDWHSTYIADLIRRTHLINWIVHPTMELSLDKGCITPKIKSLYSGIFDARPEAPGGRSLNDFRNSLGNDYTAGAKLLRAALEGDTGGSLWGGLGIPGFGTVIATGYIALVQGDIIWGLCIIATGSLFLYLLSRVNPDKRRSKWYYLILVIKFVFIVFSFIIIILGILGSIGVGNFVSTKDAEDYVDKVTLKAVTDYFIGGDKNIPPIDESKNYLPTGGNRLAEADKEALFVDVLVVGFIVVMFLMRRAIWDILFKKKKRK